MSEVPSVPPQPTAQVLRYLLVGGLAVVIDGAVYAALTSRGTVPPEAAKRVSFATGALWAFVANKYFTFGQRQFMLREPLLFALVYFTGWFLNAAVHDAVLRMTGTRTTAFLVATSISTCTNFIGQKWIVFRARRHGDAP